MDKVFCQKQYHDRTNNTYEYTYYNINIGTEEVITRGPQAYVESVCSVSTVFEFSVNVFTNFESCIEYTASFACEL